MPDSKALGGSWVFGHCPLSTEEPWTSLRVWLGGAVLRPLSQLLPQPPPQVLVEPRGTHWSWWEIIMELPA